MGGVKNIMSVRARLISGPIAFLLFSLLGIRNGRWEVTASGGWKRIILGLKLTKMVVLTKSDGGMLLRLERPLCFVEVRLEEQK